MTTTTSRVAIYARVSTFDQEPENQLEELRRYATVSLIASGSPRVHL